MHIGDPGVSFSRDLPLPKTVLTRCGRRRFLTGLSAMVSLGIVQSKNSWASSGPAIAWRSPEELVTLGFERSRVVMMNEAHDGSLRNIRTRAIGQRILPTAHTIGVRHLAMEALPAWVAELINETRELPDDAPSYLADPEMRSFVQTALDLGWTLRAYDIESDDYEPEQYESTLSLEFNNLRERIQAAKLVGILQETAPDVPLLVWCGNSHHFRLTTQIGADEFTLMGQHFVAMSGIKHFAIDQTVSVRFTDDPAQAERFTPFMAELAQLGGTAGFLTEEAPPGFFSDSRMMNAVDALILSTENELE